MTEIRQFYNNRWRYQYPTWNNGGTTKQKLGKQGHKEHNNST